MIDISFSDHQSVSIRSAVGQRKVHHLLLSATQLGQSVRDGIGDYLTAHGDFYPRGVADDGLREEDGAEAVAATVSGFQRGEVGECPVGSHLAVIAYSTRGTHILYHDRGVIHILLRQRAGRGGKAEADREAVHYVAEVEGNGTVAFHTVEGGGMKQVGGGVLLLGALVGGQGEFLDCFHVGACREKAKKLSSALLPNPSHVRLSASHVPLRKIAGYIIADSGRSSWAMNISVLSPLLKLPVPLSLMVARVPGESVASLPVKPAIAVVKRMVLPLSVPPSGVGASSCEQADNPTTPDRMAIRHIFFFIIFISLRLLNYVVFMDCG